MDETRRRNEFLSRRGIAAQWNRGRQSRQWRREAFADEDVARPGPAVLVVKVELLMSTGL